MWPKRGSDMAWCHFHEFWTERKLESSILECIFLHSVVIPPALGGERWEMSVMWKQNYISWRGTLLCVQRIVEVCLWQLGNMVSEHHTNPVSLYCQNRLDKWGQFKCVCVFSDKTLVPCCFLSCWPLKHPDNYTGHALGSWVGSDSKQLDTVEYLLSSWCKSAVCSCLAKKYLWPVRA